MSRTPRVLSVQSHVVHGYVGNKSATFPLQLLGFEVDAINSVQFSNHTGYKHFKGQVLTDKDLGDLTDALSANEIDYYTHLLTGYIGNPTFLERVAKLVQDLRRVNPDLIYVCDTVMGDIGRGMYVPETLLPIYKEKIIRLADIATPNQFEAELLSGVTIKTVEDAWKACDWFHKEGVKTVVLSSTELGDDKKLIALASQEPDTGCAKKLRVIQGIPKIEGNYTGTGDFFSALILAHYFKTKNIADALEKTVATMQSVLIRTLEMAKGTNLCLKKNIELKIVQSKNDIENPTVVVKAEIVK